MKHFEFFRTIMHNSCQANISNVVSSVKIYQNLLSNLGNQIRREKTTICSD
jgi:hypothetical protein